MAFDKPHPLDVPPWYDTAEAIVRKELNRLASQGWGEEDSTPGTWLTPYAVYCRGPHVVRVLREEIGRRFGSRTWWVREAGRIVQRPPGDVKTLPDESKPDESKPERPNVAAVPPGLLDLARAAMIAAYGDVPHECEFLDTPAANRLRTTRFRLQREKKTERLQFIDRLVTCGGGQFVAAGDSLPDRAKAVAHVLRLAPPGPFVIVAGSGQRVKDYAEALEEFLPSGSEFTLHAYLAKDDDAKDVDAKYADADDETPKAFGAGDVVIVATAFSHGVEMHPTFAIFVDVDLAAAELEPEGDDTLRVPLGMPRDTHEGSYVDHPGLAMPYWRKVGATPIGVLSPEQREAAPAAVRLFREATLGPILAWIDPPAPKSPPVTVAAAEVDAEDSQAVADAVRAACGPDGPDGPDAPTAAVVAKNGAGAAALAKKLGWPLLPIDPHPMSPAAPDPRAVVTLVTERRRTDLPRVDVLVWAAGGVDGPKKERLRSGGLVVDCLDAHADRRRAALADRGWARTTFAPTDPPHRPPEPADPAGSAGDPEKPSP